MIQKMGVQAVLPNQEPSSRQQAPPQALCMHPHEEHIRQHSLCPKMGEYMMRRTISNNGILSVESITGVEIVGMPEKP